MATETTTEVAPRGENFYVHALLGAVATVLLSFVPFSPVLGGGIAGYMQNEGTGRGTRVGAVSGVFASLPLLAVFALLFTVMSFGSVLTGEFAGPLFVVVLVGGILLVVGLYTVGFSAAGGYLGAELAASRAERRAAMATDETSAVTDPVDESRVSDTAGASATEEVSATADDYGATDGDEDDA